MFHPKKNFRNDPKTFCNVLEGFNYDEIDVIIDDICKN